MASCGVQPTGVTLTEFYSLMSPSNIQVVLWVSFLKEPAYVPKTLQTPRNSRRQPEGKQLEIKTLKQNPKNEELQDVAIHTSIERRRRQEHW